MGLCSGAEREFACTGEAEPRGSSCVLYDTYNTFCAIHIRNIGRYEWASVVCRKAQVVQSLPHHAEYGRSGAEREFLRRNIGRYEWASVVCRKAQVRSREGVPAFCMIPIIHSVQYIFAILDATNGPL